MVEGIQKAITVQAFEKSSSLERKRAVEYLCTMLYLASSIPIQGNQSTLQSRDFPLSLVWDRWEFPIATDPTYLGTLPVLQSRSFSHS